MSSVSGLTVEYSPDDICCPIVIDENGATLGRSKSCSIRLLDRLASSFHAFITQETEHSVSQYFLEDGGSKHGTKVNGRNIAGWKVVLKEGDRIQISEVVLRVQLIRCEVAERFRSDHSAEESWESREEQRAKQDAQVEEKKDFSIDYGSDRESGEESEGKERGREEETEAAVEAVRRLEKRLDTILLLHLVEGKVSILVDLHCSYSLYVSPWAAAHSQRQLAIRSLPVPLYRREREAFERAGRQARFAARRTSAERRETEITATLEAFEQRGIRL